MNGTFAATGLVARPAQVWGAVRLVPLVREEPLEGLRLDRRVYGVGDPSIVDVGDGSWYRSFIPHAFVASWDPEGDPTAAFGTQLQERPVTPRNARMKMPPRRAVRRMARGVGGNRLRFLPMHLALEGYLALHFGGPSMVWEEWTDRAVREGLTPRMEEAYCGYAVRGLADALKVFEIHPRQCGVALYVADTLASVFVVPHPSDYRALHATLLEDLYGEVLFHYATYVEAVPDFVVEIEAERVSSPADLRRAADGQVGAWERFHHLMLSGLTGEGAYTHESVYRLGPFELSRFLPSFRLDEENHIGERITHQDGRLAYCKTFRLSPAQTRRGHLLTTLHAHDWALDATATALHSTPSALARRIRESGFEGMLRQHEVDRLEREGRRRG
ncbi:ARPP-2 domain-containing protein [Embleya sp. NPDC020886]|uniref:ARPP-2 domain-containing protein n=1 Tax=Embleya sp. NPDC020886 TaxID=3363980 RepID=UPI0037A80808